ncbi:MAG: hypothetical protein P4L56_01940 [Candidatus Sulfopaludibacter sp.]|nr:hypothetical protein [Candidatus Sulfopaludibacter sp.]
MHSRTAQKPEQSPELVCAACGHRESQHGTTGSKPCLAMTGDLLAREFCSCDRFTADWSKAA